MIDSRNGRCRSHSTRNPPEPVPRSGWCANVRIATLPVGVAVAAHRREARRAGGTAPQSRYVRCSPPRRSPRPRRQPSRSTIATATTTSRGPGPAAADPSAYVPRRSMPGRPTAARRQLPRRESRPSTASITAPCTWRVIKVADESDWTPLQPARDGSAVCSPAATASAAAPGTGPQDGASAKAAFEAIPEHARRQSARARTTGRARGRTAPPQRLDASARSRSPRVRVAGTTCTVEHETPPPRPRRSHSSRRSAGAAVRPRSRCETGSPSRDSSSVQRARRPITRTASGGQGRLDRRATPARPAQERRRRRSIAPT